MKTSSTFCSARGWLTIVGMVAVLLACGGDRHAGTATDTENTLAGVVVDTAGTPLQGVKVSLVTDAYGFSQQQALASLRKNGVATILTNPGDTVIGTITDEDGYYNFSFIPPEHFSLSFQYDIDGKSSQAQLMESLDSADLVEGELQKVSLQPSSALRATLQHSLPENPLYRFSDHFRVTILGSGQVHPVIASEPFVLTGIAPGRRTLVVYPNDQFLLSKLIESGIPKDSLVRRYELVFEPGDTLVLGDLTWNLPPEFYWKAPDTVAVRKMIGGVVLLPNGQPAAGTVVRIVLDFYGFSYPFTPSQKRVVFPSTDTLWTIADTNGAWKLPMPSASEFNVEFNLGPDSLPTFTALVASPDAESELDSVVLQQAAGLRGLMFYKENGEPQFPMGSHFKVGIKGTSRYVDVIAGEEFLLHGLPEGAQHIVAYPGDPFLLEKYERVGVSPIETVQKVWVVFTAGSVLQLQAFDYNLPQALTKP